MIVYSETNFVLELALMQNEHDSCEEILALAEIGSIRLCLPGFSLAEPYETLFRRDGERQRLAKRIAEELNQLGRSKPYQAQIEAYRAVTHFLIQSGQEEEQRLNEVRARLLNTAELIPLDRQVFLSSVHAQAEHGFSPQDSIVYASVIRHLQTSVSEPSCFLNRDSHDFSAPDIEDAFANYNCKMLFSFRDGYQYIRSQI